MTQPPSFAYLLPTGVCNLHCSGCYATLEQFGRTERKGELSLAEYETVIAQLYEMGVRTFDISGGEPFLYRELEGLCRAIHRHPDARTWLVTNGTVASAERLAAVAPWIDRIVFSLDAANAELHDQMRGSVGAFAKTIASVRAARGLEFREVGVNFIVTRQNIGTVGALLDLLAEEAVDRLSLLTYRDVSENGVQYEWLPALRELREMWGCVAEHLARHEFPKTVDAVSPSFLFPDATAFRRTLPGAVRARLELHHPHLRGLTAFQQTVVVKPHGGISGDTAMVNSALFEAGSARAGVASVWAAEAPRWRERLARRQEVLRSKGPCGACSRWNYCRGGCPAAAFHQWGDLMRHDRTCEPFRERGELV